MDQGERRRGGLLPGDVSRFFKVVWFLVVLLLGVGSAVAQPRLEWARTYSLDSSKLNQPLRVAAAPGGGVYVGGSSASASGDLDYVLIRYGASGEAVWVRRFDTAGGNDTPRDMKLNPNGDITLTGTSQTVQFDFQGNIRWSEPYGGRALAADSEFVYVTGFSDLDFATAKLRGFDGTNIWTRTMNGFANQDDISQVLAIDTNRNVYVAGTEKWGCDRSGCYEFATVVKYSADGTELSKHQSTLAPDAANRGIELVRMMYDPIGRIIVTGDMVYWRYRAFWTFNYNLQLDELWQWFLGKEPPNTAQGRVRDETVDGQGNIYLTGHEGNLPAQLSVTTSKLRPNGTQVWRRNFGGVLEGLNVGVAVKVDTGGSVYVAGHVPSATSGLNIVVLKYAENGDQQWVLNSDGPTHLDDLATGLALDENGNIYVTGYSTTPEGGSEFVTLKYSEFPKIEMQPSGGMRVQFLTDPNRAYALEATADFVDWTSFVTNRADVNGLVSFEDVDALSMPYRFYRGRTVP